jgi:hypothetical protein
MMKRTHVRDYVRSRHGTSDHGGKVSEHDRGFEAAGGIQKASVTAKTGAFDKDILSEAEVLLLKRRLNAGKIKPSDIPWPEEGYKLTPEQLQKGLDWLLDQWKTPYGVERKNNPFGYREQDVLEHFKEFKLIDFYDNVNYAQVQAGIHNYLPYYRVIGTDGGTFEYYNDYTGIHILG